MAADLSAVNYVLPIASFLLVFIIVFAVLFKTKLLGENKWVQLFLSLIVAVIFVSFVGARDYVATIVPWFAVLVVALFLILFMLGFVGAKMPAFSKGIAVIFVILLAVVFIVSAFFVFSHVLVKYVPGPSYGVNANPNVTALTNWLYSAKVMGAVFLIIIAALVSWILVKAK